MYLSIILPGPGLSVAVLVEDTVNVDAPSLSGTGTGSGTCTLPPRSINAIYAKSRSMNLPAGWYIKLSMVRPAPMLLSMVAMEENDDAED